MNTLATVSEHGRLRVAERVHFRDLAEIVYTYLYLFGEPATDEQLAVINCKRLEGREYKLCAHGVHTYLIVFDPANHVFVTLWKW